MWPRSSMTTSSPGRVWSLTAIWLPIEPVGTKSAASFPSISAARSCRRLTVGSSPYTSSPTSASAIARRIEGVGLVTVSLRRSINLISAFRRKPQRPRSRAGRRRVLSAARRRPARSARPRRSARGLRRSRRARRNGSARGARRGQRLSTTDGGRGRALRRPRRARPALRARRPRRPLFNQLTYARASRSFDQRGRRPSKECAELPKP